LTNRCPSGETADRRELSRRRHNAFCDPTRLGDDDDDNDNDDDDNNYDDDNNKNDDDNYDDDDDDNDLADDGDDDNADGVRLNPTAAVRRRRFVTRRCEALLCGGDRCPGKRLSAA